MSFKRVKALLIEEFFITTKSLEVVLDLFFISVMSVVVFGYFSLFLSSRVDGPAANYLLLGMLLWEVVRVTQYSITVGAMWEVWSRNLTNLFVTPLLLQEYLFAAVISATAKSLLILSTVSLISALLFDFNITSIGALALLIAFINLLLSGIAVGLIILGAIFRFGTRIQALAWGLIFLFQPLTAVYFPLETLPGFAQAFAATLPPTHIFEMARDRLSGESISLGSVVTPLLLNVFYLGVSVVFFKYMYASSRRTGQFAKLGV
jgi:ABC-2 type transport system permease protein